MTARTRGRRGLRRPGLRAVQRVAALRCRLDVGYRERSTYRRLLEHALWAVSSMIPRARRTMSRRSRGLTWPERRRPCSELTAYTSRITAAAACDDLARRRHSAHDRSQSRRRRRMFLAINRDDPSPDTSNATPCPVLGSKTARSPSRRGGEFDPTRAGFGIDLSTWWLGHRCDLGQGVGSPARLLEFDLHEIVVGVAVDALVVGIDARVGGELVDDDGHGLRAGLEGPLLHVEHRGGGEA